MLSEEELNDLLKSLDEIGLEGVKLPLYPANEIERKKFRETIEEWLKRCQLSR
jgi:hypothetical protein